MVLDVLVAAQGRWQIFVFKINSRDLDKIANVSRRADNKDEGYQRNLVESRANDIAEYLDKKDGCIPTSILINFLKEPKYDVRAKTLTIPNQENVAWVIDGQHRMYGMRKASKPIEVIVTAFSGLDTAQQAKQFKMINSKQKGVPTSLLYDLLDLTKDGTFVEERGHDLAVRLNESSDSPWRGLIDMIGTKQMGTIITQTRVVTALDSLIAERGVLFQYTEEEQYGILRNFFQAIRELLPAEWNNKGSIVGKALGFSAFLILLPQVLTQTTQRYSDFKVSSIKRVLAPLKDFEFSTKHHHGLAGHPGENRMAGLLAATIKANPDKGKGKSKIVLK